MLTVREASDLRIHVHIHANRVHVHVHVHIHEGIIRACAFHVANKWVNVQHYGASKEYEEIMYLKREVVM